MSDVWVRDSWNRCCEEYLTIPQEWYIDRKKGISKEIRPMTKEERERAKEREEANNGE